MPVFRQKEEKRKKKDDIFKTCQEVYDAYETWSKGVVNIAVNVNRTTFPLFGTNSQFETLPFIWYFFPITVNPHMAIFLRYPKSALHKQ